MGLFRDLFLIPKSDKINRINLMFRRSLESILFFELWCFKAEIFQDRTRLTLKVNQSSNALSLFFAARYFEPTTAQFVDLRSLVYRKYFTTTMAI